MTQQPYHIKMYLNLQASISLDEAFTVILSSKFIQNIN